MAPWPPVAVKVGVLLVAVSWHFAGDGPATVLLDVDPQATEAAVATAAITVPKARGMGGIVLLSGVEQYAGQPRPVAGIRLSGRDGR
jgi:hypothetical protein